MDIFSKLQSTHNEYKFSMAPEGIHIQLAEAIGDTNPFEPYHTRPWITFPSNRVYIRKDLDAPSLITFLLLKHK